MKPLTEKIRKMSISEMEEEFPKKLSKETAFIVLDNFIQSGDDTITGLVNEIFKYSSSEEEAIGLCFMVATVEDNFSLMKTFQEISQLLPEYKKPKPCNVPFSVIPEEMVDDVLTNIGKGVKKHYSTFATIISSYLQFEEACIEGLCVLIFKCIIAVKEARS